MLSPIETRKAAKLLADCPGWTDLVRPEIDRHLHKLEDTILNSPSIATKDLEDQRAAYAALKKLLSDLHGYVMGSLASLSAEDAALFPPSVRQQMESLFTPPLRGVPSPSLPVSESPLSKLEFPPAAQFNPFAAQFTPEPVPPPDNTTAGSPVPAPSSTTVNNGQQP